MSNEVVLSAVYGALKKIESLEYVSSVSRVDNTIVVLKKNGEKSELEMIKGEKGDTGNDGISYDEVLAAESMVRIVEEYKQLSINEVKQILNIND